MPEMRKVVINTGYGGFAISNFIRARMGLPILDESRAYFSGGNLSDDEIEAFRENRLLINLIEEFGSATCSEGGAELKVIEIPEDVQYIIEDYDGMEWIAEKHRTWGKS